MNRALSFSFAVISMFGIHAQTIDQKGKNTKNDAPPARDAPMRAYTSSENVDYFIRRGASESYVWSIRDHGWAPMPTGRLFGLNWGAIKGPHVLRPGSVQEYQLACESWYEGSVKYLWEMSPGQPHPIKVGKIYLDDEVEIEWETRLSPGIRLVEQPEFPSKLSYWEPLVAPFKIETTGNGVQRVEIYANAYRNGKLVGFTWFPLVINREGYGEIEEEQEKQNVLSEKQAWARGDHRLADWHQAPFDKLQHSQLMRSDFENRHFLTKRYLKDGLRPGEFLTDTEDPNKR